MRKHLTEYVKKTEYEITKIGERWAIVNRKTRQVWCFTETLELAKEIMMDAL